jgi:sodium-independent sulfate anion transporter 11
MNIFILQALGLLMPFCAYIPKASLAAVIITAVIFSVEYEVVRPMWRSKSKNLKLLIVSEHIWELKVVIHFVQCCKNANKIHFQTPFSELDLIPGFATFFACLFWALEYGILVGVGVQIMFVLYNIARPTVKVFAKKVSYHSVDEEF